MVAGLGLGVGGSCDLVTTSDWVAILLVTLLTTLYEITH